MSSYDMRYSNEDFVQLYEGTFNNLIELWKTKGSEYSGNASRIDNFVRNAKSVGVEPEVVWAVYAGKHWDSIMSYTKDIQSGTDRVYSEPITGRFDDLMAYAMLGKAIHLARRRLSEPK